MGLTWWMWRLLGRASYGERRAYQFWLIAMLFLTMGSVFNLMPWGSIVGVIVELAGILFLVAGTVSRLLQKK